MKQDNCIYLIGEKQKALFPESSQIYEFTKKNMKEIESAELTAVIAGVFSLGQFFPGADSALTSIVHEWLRRQAEEIDTTAPLQKYCIVITAFKKLNGEISVRKIAQIQLPPGKFPLDSTEAIHGLVLDNLPNWQESLTQEGYASDSQVIQLIKESTLHHIEQTLQ